MEKKKFKVQVIRTTSSCKDFDIEASSQEEAEALAEEQALDMIWTTDLSNYEYEAQEV